MFRKSRFAQIIFRRSLRLGVFLPFNLFCLLCPLQTVRTVYHSILPEFWLLKITGFATLQGKFKGIPPALQTSLEISEISNVTVSRRRR